MLTDTAINKRSDKLIGMKENVINGKLIPEASCRLKTVILDRCAPLATESNRLFVWRSTSHAV